MSDVIDEIAAERLRQMHQEGWSEQHDDKHTRRELALAAMGYVQAASASIPADQMHVIPPPRYWPWEARWWKPTSQRRNLIKAAALIVAEIERLDRLPAPPSQAQRESGT